VHISDSYKSIHTQTPLQIAGIGLGIGLNFWTRMFFDPGTRVTLQNHSDPIEEHAHDCGGN